MKHIEATAEANTPHTGKSTRQIYTAKYAGLLLSLKAEGKSILIPDTKLNVERDNCATSASEMIASPTNITIMFVHTKCVFKGGAPGTPNDMDGSSNTAPEVTMIDTAAGWAWTMCDGVSNIVSDGACQRTGARNDQSRVRVSLHVAEITNITYPPM